MRPRPLALVLALALAAPLAHGQTRLFTFEGPTTGDLFGDAVAGAGDVDGDGFDDLLVGAPLADVAAPDAGRVYLVSGESGAPIATLDGSGLGDWFGSALDGAGDYDGDGTPDLVVGAWRASLAGTDSGSVRVVSGATMQPLATFLGSGAGEEYGSSVAGAGDFDMDGFADVVIGAPGAGTLGSNPGRVQVFSGKTSLLLLEASGEAAADGFGWSVAGAGDVNGDGFADVVVGSIAADAGAMNTGRVYVYGGGAAAGGAGLLDSFDGDFAFDLLGWSVAGAGDVDGDGLSDVIAGAPFSPLNGPDAGIARIWSVQTGLAIRTIQGDSAGDWSGFSVAGLGDLDGDLRAEVAIGSPFAATTTLQGGTARVVDGMTGSVLFSVDATARSSELGAAVAGAGDLNGDGVPELVVGARYDGAGTAAVVSGQPLGLASSAHAVSVQSGGEAVFALTAGAEHAAKAYLIAASGSGTSPGTPLGLVTVPLNLDPFTLFSIEQANGDVFVQTIGSLDGEGAAAAKLVVPASTSPNLAGTTLHFAYVALGALTLDYASNAVPVSLLP